MILDEIVKYKEKVVRREKEKTPLKDIILEIEKGIYNKKLRSFNKAIYKEGLSIIGEIKKASPSKGIIVNDFNVEKIALDYENNNIDVISVLTEDKYFMGDKKYLKEAKDVTTKPIFRKDFIIDEYQIYEAKFLGADALLFISAILDENELNEFISLAEKLKLGYLVETHSLEDIKKVLNTDANIIGINNRNLKTFETNINHTFDMLTYIPTNKKIISESGINSKEDLEILRKSVDGVLIGEAFMRKGIHSFLGTIK